MIMKRCVMLFLVLFNLNVFFINAQSKKIDSLNSIIAKRVHDTIKIKAELELANLYHDINLNKAIAIAEEAKKLLQKINYSRGWNYYYAIKCRESIYLSKYDLAIFYAKKAQKSSLKSNDVEKYVYGCFYEAIIYSLKNENKKTIVILNNTLNYLKDKKEIAVEGDIYTTLASAYSRELKNSLAIESLNKAITFCRKRNDYLGVHYCYYEMCQIYLIANNTEQAIKYCKKAIELSKKYDIINDRDYSNDLATLGNIYLLKKEYKLALETLERAKLVNQKAGGEHDKWYLVVSLISANIELKNNEKVIEICNNELKTESTIDKSIILFNYKARAYNNTNRANLAKKCIDKVFELAKDSLKNIVDNENQIAVYKNASDIYKNTGNYEKAFFYSDKYIEAIEGKHELLTEQKVAQLQAEFNDKEDEVEIHELKINEQLKSIDAEKQKNKFFMVALALILISSILFFVARRNISIKKRNSILDKHNEEINEKNGLLSRALFEKEILIKEIHHRVKNNLQLVMSMLNIQSRKSSHPDVVEFMEKGQARITSMALIHQNLYQTENVSEVDFEQYLKELVESVTSSYGESIKNIEIKIDISKVFLDIQAAIPLGLIVNELICNALKYAFPNQQKGEVLIWAKQSDDKKVEFIFKDNGVGDKETKMNKESIGLKLVELLTQQLNGLLQKKNNNGLEYKIVF